MSAAGWQAAQGVGQCRLPATSKQPWLGPVERSSARSMGPLALRPPIVEEIEDIEPAELIEGLAAVPARRKARRVVQPSTEAVQAPVAIEPEDAIRMALRLKRGQFEYCYQRELKKQAAFSGFVVVAINVSIDGVVTSARVQEGNPRDAAVGGCIAAQLKTMRLPLLTSEAELILPIRLEAKDPS